MLMACRLMAFQTDRYEQVLNRQVLPHFILPEMGQAILQQEVASPHFRFSVKQLLNNVVSNIKRRNLPGQRKFQR